MAPSKSRKRKASSWAKNSAQHKMTSGQNGGGGVEGSSGNRLGGSEGGGKAVWAENLQAALGTRCSQAAEGLQHQPELGCL